MTEVRSMNTVYTVLAFPMPVLRYGFDIIRWTQTDI